MIKKNRRKTLFLSTFFVFLLAVSPVRAAAGDLSFTTEPQAVAIGLLSDRITVSLGEPVGETADLFLKSSSATGEFFSSDTSSEPTDRLTWNSNWSNRNFYYRDVTAGTHALTATLTLRSGGQSQSIEQTIVVGSKGATVDSDSESSAEDTELAGVSNRASGPSSAHEGLTSIVSGGGSSGRRGLAVDPGRDRLVSVGVPVEFKAELSGGRPMIGPDGIGVKTTWSFGDGNRGNLLGATHTYHFPGTYIVVVNVSQGDEKAVGRTTVEVVEPKVEFVEFGLSPKPYVLVRNNTGREINLGHWQVRLAKNGSEKGGDSIILPPDTIIGPKAEIYLTLGESKFPAAQAASVSLIYPNGELMATRQVLSSAVVTEAEEFPATSSRRALLEELETLKSRLAHLSAPAKSPVVKSPKVANLKPPANLSPQAVTQMAPLAVVAANSGASHQDDISEFERKPEVVIIDPNQNKSGIFSRLWRVIFR